LERDVSERHSFSGYDFEVRGHDLVVRDARGDVVETVSLENIDGEFQLPNGQQVDLASLLLNKELDPADFETAAGGAQGAGGPESGPVAFRAFEGGDDGFTREEAAGTLDDTSLSYSVIDSDQEPADQRAFAEMAIFTEPTRPVNWASHDEWSIPENQDGGDFGRLVDGDPADFTFVVSDDRFDVVDGVLQLKDGFSFDFETESFIDVQITATSKTGESKTQSVHIDVVDENEGQTGIDLDNALVAENAAGAVIGKLTVSDPDAGDSQSFLLSDTRFEVVNGQLKLKDGVSLDFETEPSVNVTVTATDKGGHSISQQFTIVVGDVNEAQTALSLDHNTVSENAAGAVIGSLTVADPDAGDSQSFVVSDSRFEIVNGELKLKDGMSLDFETEQTIDMTVTATDKGGHSISQDFSIVVGDVNEAQTALSLNGAYVAENAAGAVIGDLTVADPDKGDSQTFAVSDNRFEVVNGQLKLKDGVSLDFETEPTVNVTVTATDKGGHSIAEQFTLGVGNVNEAPLSLTLTTTSDQLLVNGSFEADKLNNGQWKLFSGVEGWKTDTQVEIQNNVTNKASNGAQVVELDADYAVDNLYQSVKTTAGHVYELSFDTSTRGDTKHTDTIEVYWNGVKVGVADPQSTTWQTSTFQVIGTGGDDRLEFREVGGKNDSYGGLLDNVSLKGMGSSVPENFAGVVIGALNVTDPDVGDTHSFAVSDSRFEVVDGQLKLKDGVSFNYEAEQSVTVTVTATDMGGNAISKDFTINVVDVNEAQTALTWTGVSVAENSKGAVAGTLWVADPDAGDSQSFSVSDSRFEVVNSQLKLKSGQSLNFETEPSVNVTVTATDKGGHQIVRTFTVNVADVNEAPTAIQLSNANVAENATGATIGKLTTTDPDAGDTFAYQVSDSRFQVVNGQLQLKSGVSFDYETEPSVNLKVTSTDSAGHAIQQSFTVSVTNVNEAPVVTVKDGSLENHIVNTSTAYNPVANATVGADLYSNDSSGVKVPSASLLNGVDASNMTLTAPTDVTVTFQKEAAGNRNMVGTYRYDDNGNIIAGSVKFVWLDASANTEGKLGSSMVNDFLGYGQANTVSLGTMVAGTHIGFFTISNGAGDAANRTLLSSAAAGTASQAAAMAAITSQLSIKVDANGNGHVFVGNSQMNGDVFFTHNKSLNTDFNGSSDIDHMASGVNSNLPNQLVVGVEDLNGGGDRDYNDVVFSVNLGTYNVNKTTQSFVQPNVDFSDVDSHSLSQAVIHSTGFQAGDALNIPASGMFNVNVVHTTNDYTITVTGKTGTETVDQFESFVNSITFSTSGKAEGARGIDYNIVDEGGLTSNVGHATVGVTNSYEISASQLAANQNTLGSGNDHLYMNASMTGKMDFGNGYDTLHLAKQDQGFGHSDAVKFSNVEAVDSTGYGMNKVALSINDVLDMTDGGNHLTVLGDKGDTVTLSGDGSSHHWSVASTGNDFTTYVWSDPLHQAVVEISNQLTATLSS
jgi:VCBS repeat-containing protein